MGIKTTLLEEKATACHMLCCYIGDLKEGLFLSLFSPPHSRSLSLSSAGFFPYIGSVLHILIDLLTFFYNEDVRHAAASGKPLSISPVCDPAYLSLFCAGACVAMPDILNSCVCAIKLNMAQAGLPTSRVPRHVNSNSQNSHRIRRNSRALERTDSEDISQIHPGFGNRG